MAADQSSNQPADAPTDDIMSPAARKQLQRCFERAHEVLRQEKPDRDYAHTMFTECVLRDPGNLEYTEGMLDNLQRKYNNNKRGARLKGFGGRSSFKKAVAAEAWDEVFSQGLDLLKVNPWDVTTLQSLARACQVNRLNEVELRYLKNALDVNPKDKGVCKHCAESLARMGQFDQAIALWHRIEELDKGNTEARQMVSDLTLAKQRGVLPGTESAAPAAAAKSVKKTLPTDKHKDTDTSQTAAQADEPQTQQRPTKPTRSIEELEQALQSEDAELETYTELANAYTSENRFRDAYQTLKRGLDASGGSNLKMLEQTEDAQIRMTRSQVAIAEKRAAAEKTTEAADLARRFRAELNRQEIQIFSARCERYPDDLSLKYELAVRLKRDGNHRAARQSFEAARSDPALRASATLELGECFQQLKQYANAIKCYQAASRAAEEGSETHHLALYRLGVLATALKNLETAEDALDQLVKINPSFRDAQDRLDKVRQISDSS